MSDAPMHAEPCLALWCHANPDLAAAEIERLRNALDPFTKYGVGMIGFAESVRKGDYQDFHWVVATSGIQPDFRHFNDAVSALALPQATDVGRGQDRG